MPRALNRTRTRASKATLNKSYSAPALEKGIDIVEALADAQSGLTVSEIAGKLGRPMSELFRIIIVMQQRGWLQKDPESARYYVTYRVLRLAHRSTPAQSLTAAAAPVMHELSVRINQSCHLVVRSGTEGLVIHRHENQRRHANLSVRMGAVINLYSSCSGQVLLAYMDDAERDRAIPPARRSAKLNKALDLIRKRGYEIHQSPITPGVTDIGVPIRDLDGKVIAAMTIPYLHALDDSLPFSVDDTRRHAERAARRISHALGWER